MHHIYRSFIYTPQGGAIESNAADDAVMVIRNGLHILRLSDRNITSQENCRAWRMKGQGLIAVMGGTVLILESEMKHAISVTEYNVLHPYHCFVHTRMCDREKTDANHGHPSRCFRPI